MKANGSLVAQRRLEWGRVVEGGGALSRGWTFPEAPLRAGSPNRFRTSGRSLPNGLPSLWRLSPRDVGGRHRDVGGVPGGAGLWGLRRGKPGKERV